MERESFEKRQVADLLNADFVSIKGISDLNSRLIIVDREERPDIDQIYMTFVQATTGHGGWPLNVFLTPDLEPIFGGTYFPGPGAARVGRPDFTNILQKINILWKTERERVKASGNSIIQQIREFVLPAR